MNYIKRLQAENAEHRKTIRAACQEVEDLYGYLASSKFHEDTTVQVADVFRRTAGLKSLLIS